MTMQIATQEAGAALERVMVNGDLSGLTPAQRSAYYMRVCESLGLNPLTKPFAYLKLNGKLVLYALRDCADQLRRQRGISIEIVDKKLTDGLLSVHVRATDKDGRRDEDVGVVPVAGKLQGEAGANLIMKAVTKAKRRVTLSIAGLGMLDETEVSSIPDAQVVADDDCRGPQPQQKAIGPQSSPEELLRHLEEAFGACGDLEVLEETWEAYANQIGQLPRRERGIADQHFERRQSELQKAAA